MCVDHTQKVTAVFRVVVWGVAVWGDINMKRLK